MDLPKGWAVSNFEDTVQVLDTFREPINNTKRMQRIEGKQKNELYPYYGATGLVGYIDGYLLDGEYVLLGEDGAPFLDASANKAYIVKGKVWVNNHAHVLLSCLSNRFLCYYLNQLDYKEYVSGTTRLKLTQGSMKRMPIIMPPLAEQHRIVAKIDALFSELVKGVEMLSTVRKQLRTYRQAALKWAFEGKLSGNTETLFCTVSMKDIVLQYQNGISKRNGNVGIKYKVLRLSDLENFRITEKSPRFIDLTESEIKKYNLLPNDLVLIRVNGSKELVGRLIIITNEHEWAYCDHFIRVRLQPRMAFSPYIRHLFDSKQIRGLISHKMVSTAGQNTISQTSINELFLPLPSVEVQKQIVAEIESRLSVCDKLEQLVDECLGKARALKQSILKKAFTGQLVPQDPDDEPAEELLKRIKQAQSVKPK